MRRRILLSLAVVVTTAAVIGLGLGGYTWWRLATIKTFDTTTSPTPSASPTTDMIPLPTKAEVFLVFSVGSEGIDAADGARLGIGRGRAKMADGLTDSIMLMIADPTTRRLGVVSIPRDSWLADRGHRINESYNRYGINGFISDVSNLTGLHIDHAVSVNFAAFADLTDAVGGVDIALDNPVRDAKSKLDLPAGCVHLDGPDALAFVRSRHWQVFSNGSWRADATSSDWGRIERQQSFLRLVLSRILTPELPLRIPALVDVAGDNLTIDEGLTVSSMLSWAKAFATGVDDIAAATIPGRGFTTEQGASVIGVDPVTVRATVERVLARIGSPAAVSPESGTAASAAPTPTLSMTTAAVTPTVTSPDVVGGRISNAPMTPAPSLAPSATASTTPLKAGVSPKPSTTSTTVTPSVSATPSSKPSAWRPDNGDGQGGLRFKACG